MKNRPDLDRLMDHWSRIPVGTQVVVFKDDGSTLLTKTRSAPWVVGDRTPIIKVEGIAGGYALERVKLAEPQLMSLLAVAKAAEAQLTHDCASQPSPCFGSCSGLESIEAALEVAYRAGALPRPVQTSGGGS